VLINGQLCKIQSIMDENEKFLVDVTKFLWTAARSGRYSTVDQLLEAAEREFPVCHKVFIRQCLVRLGSTAWEQPVDEDQDA
jgi:hypothetical protein